MWKEIGKSILKATIVAEGTKIMVEKVLPRATDLSKDVWKRIKKAKGSEEEPEVTVEKAEEDSKTTHRPVNTKIISSKGPRVYDAEWKDR